MKRNAALKSSFSARSNKTKNFVFQVFKPFRIVLRRIGFEKVRVRIFAQAVILINLTRLLNFFLQKSHIKTEVIRSKNEIKSKNLLAANNIGVDAFDFVKRSNFRPSRRAR